MLIAFIILEAATVQMVALWFILGAIAAFIASLFHVGIAWEIAIFIIVSIITLLLLRPLMKRHLVKRRVPTNADMVIGRIGIVTEDIDNDNCKGRVYALNLDWAARSYYNNKIKKGSKVSVCAIDGVKLIVVPEKEEK